MNFRKILGFAMAICLVAGGTGIASVAAKAAEELPYMTDTAIVEHDLMGAPSVITRLKGEETLTALNATDEIPSNLIMTMNADGNIVGEDGETLGYFTDFYKEHVQAKLIPVVEVKDSAAGEKLVDIWKNEVSIIDMAVLSADASVLSDVRTALPKIRGIFDCTGKTLTTDKTLYSQIRTANLSMANVILLSEAQATLDVVDYFQQRFKTVWTVADESDFDTFSVKSMVSTGTYGIVADNFTTVYGTYGDYGEKSVARISANIAHRGLPATMTENTLAGYKKAYEYGATHIEIDTHLSVDGEIIVMHDASIDRTTNGKGAVSSMTLAQLQEYKVTKTMGGIEIGEEPIPTARDVFEEFKGKDIVVVFEIKTGDTAICNALRELLDEYDFWDQIVIISFNDTIIRACQRDIPEVPTASLSAFPRSYFETNAPKFNEMNTVADVSLGYLGETDYYESTMKDRGYMSYAWTYGVSQDCVAAMAKGVYGLTNNAADVYGEMRTGALWGKEGQTMEKEALKKGEKLRIVTQTYKGEEKEVNGTIFAVKDCGDYAEVIAYYTEAEFLLYTPAFRVDYPVKSAPTTDKKSGCGSSLAENTAGILLACVSVFAAARKMKKRED